MDAAILHADLDAFYASVEQLLRSVVCAASRSRSAAASCSRRRTKPRPSACGAACRAGGRANSVRDLIFVGGHFSEYQRLGDAAIDVLRDFTPEVERISIDEAFADVSGSTHLFGAPAEIAQTVRARVRAEIGLADFDRRRAHQAPGEDRLAGRQARRPGRRRSRARTGIPARPAGRADVGRGSGDEGAARRGGHHDDRPAGAELARIAWSDCSGRAVGEKLTALAWNRDPREIQTHRRAHSAGAQSALGRKPALERVFRPVLHHLAERIAGRLRAKERPCRTVTVRVRFADLRVGDARRSRCRRRSRRRRRSTEIADRSGARRAARPPREKTISLLAISASHLGETDPAIGAAVRACRRRPSGPARARASREDAPTAPSMRSATRFGWEAVGYASARSASHRAVPDEFRSLAEKEL